MNTPASQFHDIATALTNEGWCVVPDFLSAAQTQALADECHALRDAQRLTPARVGALRTATPLRGDSTHWFQADALSPPQQGFVVPKGIVHRTRAPERAIILMVEGAGIVPTGDE